MSNSIPFNLDPPGTYLYTGQMATKGFKLTRFGLSLRDPANRERFLKDEAAYMREAGLNEEEIRLVLARDWTGLIEAGGHLQAMLKVAATVGQNLWHIGAHNAGMEVEELMRICPRTVSALPEGEK
ncbi:protocatechuate 3,4-dioxygenase [Chelativorans sp.]|uniref:protocatechuate 3,4-dioxygenase n=1 Tax=Chelativorans sp. TaxID=2203393 RepID=UPI0028125532|nr:protocatechuate 3,4-dioxygenase [Chelativorans sp.]